jgi:hypothetical protein
MIPMSRAMLTLSMFVTLAAVACNRPDSWDAGAPARERPRESTPPPAEAPVAAPPVEAPVPAPVPKLVPGPAYFAVDGTGVVRLDENGLERVWKPAMFPRDLTLNERYGTPREGHLGLRYQTLDSPELLVFQGLDGFVYVSEDTVVHRFEADGSVTMVIDAGLENLGMDSHHVDTHGELWMTNGRLNALFHVVAGKLEVIDVPGESRLCDAVFNADGLWVLRDLTLMRRTANGRWTTVEIVSKAARMRFEDLVVTSRGAVFGHGRGHLFRADLSGVVPVDWSGHHLPKPWIGQPETLITNTSATAVLVSGGGCAALRLDPASNQVMWASGPGPDFLCEGFLTMAVDDAHRIWIASRGGLTVLGPNDERTEFVMGSIERLIGDIGSMVVVGAGPSLPEPEPLVTGTRVIELVGEDSLITNVPVELCPSPIINEHIATPCTGSRARFVGRSNENGIVVFREVPLGPVAIAVQAEGQWIRASLWPRHLDSHKKNEAYGYRGFVDRPPTFQ